jgi:hypothetical protein
MTETVTPPGITGELLYAEDRSGLERRVVVQAIVAPLILIAISVPYGLVASNGLAALLLIPWGIAGIWTLISLAGLIYNWPIGMRIDSAGIRIGGLRAWEKRQLSGQWPPRKPFHVGSQGRAVFTCPWEGVTELYLITSLAEFKPLIQQKRAFRKRTSQLRTPLGFLGTVKAGLVVVTNPALTHSDPEAFRANRSQIGPVKGILSPTWLVPTRHPQGLRSALAQAPGAPPVQDHLPPGKEFAFYRTDLSRRSS